MATYAGPPKKRPPKDKMPGPNAPDPKPGPPGGVLGPGGLKGGYAIPGFGEWAEKKNNRRYDQTHAFNPGRNLRNRRWS